MERWPQSKIASKTASLIIALASLMITTQASAALSKVEDNASGWTYQNFPQYKDSAASGGTAHGGQVNGGSATYTFTGDTVQVYTWKGPDGGQLEVQVDGVSKGTFSLVAGSDTYKQLLASVTGLSNQSHRLVVYARSTQWNMIDYIMVGSSGSPTPTPTATPTPTPTPTPSPTATPSPTPTPTPSPTPAGNAFYLSPSGSDSNPGTLAAPFATLAKAQSAMRASSTIKTVYLRAGNYSLPSISNCIDSSTCGLSLTSADNGETWSYYPADGYNSASISGGSTANGNGLVYMIALNGESNVTFNGLALHNFQYAAFGTFGDTNVTIKNCLMYNGFYVVVDDNPGAISFFNAAGATISHNVIHDMASWGIVTAGSGSSNVSVDGNVVYNTCTKVADCSAIYAIDDTGKMTNVRWTNNYVRDGNLFAGLNSHSGSGFYADDCTGNITMSGNVLTGRNGSNSIHLHGGNNIKITNNVEDLGTYGQTVLTLQPSPGVGCSAGTMSGIVFESNVVIGNYNFEGGGYLELGTPGQAPTVMNNNYYNYGSGQVDSIGDFNDSHPSTANPQLSGYGYSVAAGSPILSAPVSFTPLAASFGYPGYAIPASGSVPSDPH